MSLTSPEKAALKDMANAVRALAIDAVEKAKSGHPGLPMGAADIATVLFTRFLKFDASAPDWADRDRFILSAGHGSMLLYALLYLSGYDSVSIDDIKNFRQLGFKTPGHPENFVTKGIETTTGPLGQGLANSIGFAIAERHLNAKFGDDLVDHFTYVLASDGDLMEGISQESITLAGHLKLNRLIVLFDDNHITIDGALSLSDSTDQVKRFEAAGWNAVRIDGHDVEAIASAIEAAQSSDKPSLIACRTKIGFGSPKKEGTSKAHGEPLGEEELKAAKASYGWTAAPFEVPADILKSWRNAGSRCKTEREAWEKHAKAKPAFNDFLNIDLSTLGAELIKLKQTVAAEGKELATRKSSELALETINAIVPQTIGGSADLSGSNNTKTKTQDALTAENYGGRYIYYGIREHGMAAAMNGMALHGGTIPYGGTFLTFADYCRPSIRLAALMGVRSIFVMTHDSIGLGEDGPTHQPVEHVASLRAMPNLLVFRPADTVETIEAWECALQNDERPSLLALTRQNLPQLRKENLEQNLTARGAYILSETPDADVTLFATGSELSLAVQAKDELAKQNVKARVVSVPCFELFEEQDEAYKAKVLGTSKVKIAIEAGVRQGWDRFIGSDGLFVGMNGFGASAPAKVLFEHFGITAKAVVDAALNKLRAS
ncbi:MAG: transketolase [Pseudomonadota bacterium]